MIENPNLVRYVEKEDVVQPPERGVPTRSVSRSTVFDEKKKYADQQNPTGQHAQALQSANAERTSVSDVCDFSLTSTMTCSGASLSRSFLSSASESASSSQ